MTTIPINVPAKVSEPRGSAAAAYGFAALLNWFERTSARRTSRRLAAERQAEAAQVRDFARQMAEQDPRFAADLCAAADRHEIGQ